MEPVLVAFACVVTVERHAQGQGRGVFPCVVPLVLQSSCWLGEGYTGMQRVCALRFGYVACVSYVISPRDEVAVVGVGFLAAAIAGCASALA